MPRTPSRPRGGGRTVRLRPANPFDLIRLIARSQSDPRKAMAELVQNSLDAGGRLITITRQRRRGETALSVFDDGRGIFPEMDRPEALERIATNIGHSFKRNLSPAERKQEMLLGKYGIGILGFWSLGKELEIRTRVGGSEVWALRLKEDRPEAEVFKVPQRQMSFPGETWTELLIRGVHPAASRAISGRRLGDYLAAELRGQLLERDVKLRMVDRLAKRSDLKSFFIKPQRFRGRRLHSLDELPVPGYSGARIELYYVGELEGEQPAVALTCGGSRVGDDLAALDGCDFNRPPWSAGCWEGVVEFPDLEVAPATRRGFVPNAASDALLAALRSIEPELEAVLARERERLRAEQDESLAREIRKAFLPLIKTLPQYDFFEVPPEARRDGKLPEDGGARVGRMEDGDAPAEESGTEVVDAGDLPEPEAELLPPGPLAGVRIAPRRLRLLPGAARTLIARAQDGSGRRIEEGVDFRWSLRQGGGALAAEGGRASYTAPLEIGPVMVSVEARQGEAAFAAEAEIEVVEKLSGDRPDAGIPEPQRVSDPTGDWRSRASGRRWEYNAAHPDYQAVVDDPRKRFRYLVHLFAKEIVLRNYGEPKDERLLERMVEVLTHIRSRL